MQTLLRPDSSAPCSGSSLSKSSIASLCGYRPGVPAFSVSGFPKKVASCSGLLSLTQTLLHCKNPASNPVCTGVIILRHEPPPVEVIGQANPVSLWYPSQQLRHPCSCPRATASSPLPLSRRAVLVVEHDPLRHVVRDDKGVPSGSPDSPVAINHSGRLAWTNFDAWSSSCHAARKTPSARSPTRSSPP